MPSDIQFNEEESTLFVVLTGMRPPLIATATLYGAGDLANHTADRIDRYYKLLSLVGFDVHRMNSDKSPPAPVPGTPTIYVGTSQDVGFNFLKTGAVPGQDGTIRIDAGVDEIDEAFVYSNGQYILSEGVQGDASPETITQVQEPAGSCNGYPGQGRPVRRPGAVAGDRRHSPLLRLPAENQR